MKIKKIKENIYEIPKTGKMKVSALVYASENILEDIKKDQTLEQVSNVAQLPGIIKASLAMPDAHRGYGFSIGGVAAFDLDKGIISPGGVGYDINCLTGDSNILTEFGASIPIKEFSNLNSSDNIEQDGRILKRVFSNIQLQTLNLNTKEQENKKINFFMERQKEDIYEIGLESGLKIKASLDHPFLTKQGMKTVSNLSEKESLATNLFKGVNYHKEINRKLAISTKILGYMFGDGCLYESSNKIYGTAYGSLEDLKEIQKDLESINVNSKIYSRERNHAIETKYGKREFQAAHHELHIYSKEFKETLKKLGMPLGNKTRQKFSVPKWIKKSNKLIKRLFLAGFFGAELSSPNTSSKTGFYCPTLDQNKIEKFTDSCRSFLIDISLLLEEFDVKINKISEMEDHKNKYKEVTKRFRLLISSEEENLLRLWRNIGFEYNQKRRNLADISSLYILLKKQENKKRQEIAKKIEEYKKKGFSLKEVQRIFEEKINKRFIERHYYENAGQRINLNFISFKDFSEKKLKEMKEHGAIFDKIKKIKKIKGNIQVYDFNIQDNHNFVANSFIVSNCGVRLLKTNLMKKDLKNKEKIILDRLYNKIPSGVGRGSPFNLNKKQLNEVLEKGAKYLVDKGFGTKEDLKNIEENGTLKGKDSDVSERAKKRGIGQLGTLGAGNHFLEFQIVDEIFDSTTSKRFGLSKGQIVIMIHCGSRGLGHQVASDYIKLMEQEYGFENLPDRELINAPIKSKLGKEYLSAMNCAANFAFANRQLITYWIRESLSEIFSKIKIDVVYDVCHNIAKIEEHLVDTSKGTSGKKKDVCVHRKGATRSFDKQPVLIPGSMGTSSYVLVGTKKAEELTFGSTVHGAGRVSSRSSALKEIKGEQVKEELHKKGIEVKSGSWKAIATEAPQVYKDIDEVVRVVEELGINKKVARLKPIVVIKG